MGAKSNHPSLEICIDNYDDAIIAIDSGADRLETCSRLDQDGLTPHVELVLAIADYTDIPQRIMIRPRAGNFCYDMQEVLEMVAQIERFKELDVEGFVFGCLDVFDDIDESALSMLTEASQGYGKTFHRAFDDVIDQQVSLQLLKDHDIDTVLTSGRSGNAISHLKILSQLNGWAGDDINILVGGGVAPDNALLIIDKTGIRQLHASLNVAGKKISPEQKVQGLKECIVL